jgi:hypothetical protein
MSTKQRTLSWLSDLQEESSTRRGIASAFIYLLSACFAVCIPINSEAQTGSASVFRATNHPKSGGLDFSISYPSSWTAKEGKRPHIVQMFVAPDSGEFFNITVLDLEQNDQTACDEIVSKDGMMTLLPSGAEMVSHSVTKLDGEKCGMTECVFNSERAGIKMEMRSVYFAVPIKDKLIILAGSVGGLSKSPDLSTKYASAKPRLLGIAASLVLMDKWNAISMPVSTVAPEGFVNVAAGGLYLQLPKELSLLSEENTSGGEIESLKKMSCVSGTRSIIIKHFVFKKTTQISPEAAAKMTEGDLKKETDYVAKQKNTTVDGLEGVLLDTKWQKMGASASQSILFFSKDNHLWEVHMFGVNDDEPDALEDSKFKVFKSIKIKS